MLFTKVELQSYSDGIGVRCPACGKSTGFNTKGVAEAGNRVEIHRECVSCKFPFTEIYVRHSIMASGGKPQKLPNPVKEQKTPPQPKK